MSDFQKPQELLSFFHRAAEFTAELMEENTRLRKELGIVEERTSKHQERFARIEQQNELLQNLFVVIHQLHSTLDAHDVLTAVRDVVVNIIGAEHYRIWLLEGEKLEVAAEDGPDLSVNPVELVGKLGDRPWMTSSPTEGGPPAFLSLRAGERHIGYIAVFKLLRQKPSLGRADEEVMELLSTQGGVALYAARLASQSKSFRI